MKNKIIPCLVLVLSLVNIPVISQTDSQAENDTTLLGLPGDNLDLFAVLDLFQKSPSIEEFEKSLNLEETGINNLDLNLDEKVDFIKVVTEQDGEDFTFVLQVDVSEEETQDVAVILVSKDKDEKVTMQMVGDKDLYGKDYVIEPTPPAPKVTANPAYTGTEPVESTPATTEVIVVESTPIVKYVYSPVYVPYYPPYTYAYPPPYFRAIAVVSIGIYRHNHYYHHHGYHGGYRGGYHGNTVVVHNHNTYNNYHNNSRHRSNTVNRNNANGNYRNNRPSASTRPSGGASASQRPSNRASTAARPSTRPSPSASQSRPSPSSANRSASPSAGRSRGSSPSYSSQHSRSSSGSRSMGATPSRSSGGASRGGASRGGGGGRRR